MHILDSTDTSPSILKKGQWDYLLDQPYTTIKFYI